MNLVRSFCNNYIVILSFLLGLLAHYWLQQSTMECSAADQLPITSPNEEFQPKLNLASKPQKPKKVAKSFVRPRYYSTELGIRERLFMGVMTTRATVRSLAVAVNKTTSHYVDKLMFFMDAAGAEKAKVVNLKLPGIVGFVDSREVLKPFHMLKYLTDNFLEEYDFFFLTRDSTYVNPHLLVDTIKEISVSEDVHLGFLPASDSCLYCSLDSGILLSNSVLKKIRTTLDWCVKNAFSDTDDDNFGRCVLYASHLPCKNITLGVAPLDSVNLTGLEVDSLWHRDLDSVFSYFPLKEERMILDLHLRLSKKTLSSLNSMIDNMERHINTDELAWPPGSYSPKIPPTRFDLTAWQYFDLEQIYMYSDFITTQKLSGADKADVLDIVERVIAWTKTRYPELVYRELLNGYRRFDPSRGMDYILDMSFSDSVGLTQIKSFEVCKELGKVEILPMPYVTENGRIHILLPLLSADYEAANLFMTKYSQSCTQADLTFLILILLYEPDSPGKGHSDDVFKNTKNRAIELSAKKNRDCKITWISIRIPKIGPADIPIEDHLIYFAIMDLVSKKLAPESLILFTEPYVELRQDFLNRVRMGTIINKQVFSPIPFTEYAPNIVYGNMTVPKGPFEIHKNSGRFDSNNTKHIAFYMSDYSSARSNITYLPFVRGDKDILKMFTAFDSQISENKIVSLLDMFSRLDMSILRATEPSLRLRRSTCSYKSKNRRVTSFSRCDAPMGTRSQMGQVVLDMESQTQS